MSEKFTTTFEVESAELHNAFKVKCIQENTSQKAVLNNFMKRYSEGTHDLVKVYADQIGITREELVERLNNMEA